MTTILMTNIPVKPTETSFKWFVSLKGPTGKADLIWIPSGIVHLVFWILKSRYEACLQKASTPLWYYTKKQNGKKSETCLIWKGSRLKFRANWSIFITNRNGVEVIQKHVETIRNRYLADLMRHRTQTYDARCLLLLLSCTCCLSNSLPGDTLVISSPRKAFSQISKYSD